MSLGLFENFITIIGNFQKFVMSKNQILIDRLNRLALSQ